MLVSKSKTNSLDRLKREKKHLKVLLYRLLTLSSLGEESVKNQGSSRCMELLYRNKAEGRLLLGRLIDYYLLRLPVSKATRERRKTVIRLVEQHLPRKTLLYIPCGTASELATLARRHPDTTFIGMDLDVSHAKKRTKGLSNVKIYKKNAFDYKSYPVKKVDILLTIGLVDYLGLKETADFYKNLARFLTKGGVLITSTIGKHKHADSLMKEFADFTPVYKTEKDLRNCLVKAGFKCRVWRDDYTIHSFAIARKK
ncbi:TPA: methyltransferase domain-containing protein [Candidatus Woesearchaeota archaeon]|nr:methyltransferase domain-containing protein [Candidatus Woesearchaeota archaeon]